MPMKREAAWRRYLRFWGANPEADVDDEFRFHLETKIEELRARGLSPAEARREALRQFGPVPAARAECIAVSRSLERRASRTEYLSGWYGDLRYAIRVLWKAKTSTAAAILILAVGIGATTAVFTLLDRMIYEPLPVPKPSQLVMLTHSFMEPKGKSLGGQTFTYPGYVHLRDHQAVFSGLAAEATLSARERHAHEHIELPAGATLVSGNYFDVLGVRPFAGRALDAADDVRSAASHVAIASYRFASRRYQQPQDALGKTVYLRDIPFLIAGVMQPGFYGTQKGYDSDLYVPMGSLPELFPELQFDRGAYVRPIGRLRPDMDMVRARSDLQVLWDQLPASVRGLVETGPTRTEDQIECASGARGYAGTSSERERSLKLLGAIVALLLLIGCANVACLLVARGVARQHETAIRLSLGAGRARILRQSFVESCVLALAGGAGALLVAQWGSRLLLVAFHWQKRPIEIAPDARVLVFALIVSLLSAILFGLAPAVQLLRGGRVPLTQEHSVAPFASGKVLVSLEVGLSLILLAGAATFIRSLQNLRAVPTGFVARDVSVVRLHRNPDGDALNPPLREAMALADSLRGAPGVQSASLSNFVIFNDAYVLRTVRPLDSPKAFSMHQLVVAPGYWDVLRIPILSGRGFTGRDDERAPRVAVLNRSIAERLFPNQNPLGKHILVGGSISPYRPGDDTEVVGIAKDTKFTSVSAPAPDLVYLPLLQAQTNSQGLVLEARSSMDPAALGAVVRARIRDAHLPLTMQSATALYDEIGVSLADDYIRMQASSIFGGLALALIASGLYGLMVYTVARRTREIGIRAAIGASTLGIMVLVLRHSFRLVAVGIVIGIPGAVAVMRALSGIVFGLPPVDFASLGIGAALLLIAGAAASFVPAWRAAHLDPMQALRVQ
jgi:predicted permease